MGGFNSGRRGRRYYAVEDCLPLALSALRRDGVLRPGWSGAWKWPHGQRIGLRCQEDRGDLLVVLSFTVTLSGRQQPVSQDLWIQRALVFGHPRLWFGCPNCRANRGAVHLAPGIAYFSCRGCLQLSYRSVQEHDSRVDALRRFLPPDREPLDIDSPFMSLPRLKADMLGPLVRRDPRFPRRRVERILDYGIRLSYEYGHAEPADDHDRVALP